MKTKKENIFSKFPPQLNFLQGEVFAVVYCTGSRYIRPLNPNANPNSVPVLDKSEGFGDHHNVEQQHHNEVDGVQGRQDFVTTEAGARLQFMHILHPEQ